MYYATNDPPMYQKICFDEYPQSPTKWRFACLPPMPNSFSLNFIMFYRYINSGVFMGFAREARDIYTKALGTMSFEELNNKIDQEMLSEIYMKEAEKFKMSLDYNCDLFQSMHQSLDDVKLEGDSSISNEKYYRNIITNTTPGILHCKKNQNFQTDFRIDEFLFFFLSKVNGKKEPVDIYEPNTKQNKHLLDSQEKRQALAKFQFQVIPISDFDPKGTVTYADVCKNHLQQNKFCDQTCINFSIP